MRFALLSETELRLVDLMFDAGVFRQVPVVVQPPEERGPASPRIRSLVRGTPRIEATARRMGGAIAYGSVDELVRIAERCRRDGDPASGSQRG